MLQRNITISGLVTILLVTFFVYFPGLDSRFIFDDAYNLQGLGDITSHGFFYYLFGSGFAGASGRPLSLLSFVLQYQNWPLNPFAFKCFNLIIHLMNGILVYIFCSFLSKQISMPARQRSMFALTVMGLWLLHPVHVNTVLYTIQRMTEISALFSLLGMIGYLHGRSLLASDKLRQGFSWIVFSAWGCTIFAILGKENGIMLPVYLMVLELVAFPGKNQSNSNKLSLSIWALIAFPLMLFSAYLALNISHLLSAFNYRDYTPVERVLTELTVIVEYLKVLVFPHPTAFAFYHDGYPISRSLMSPVFTLFAFLLIIVLLSIGILIRKVYPLCAVGILLFFSGHLLEAGPFNLELYFEYRNYLPSIGIMILIAWVITSAIQIRRYKIPASVFIVFYSLSLVSTSAVEASLWSNPYVQITEWVKVNPESDRSKQDLAMLYMDHGNFDESEKLLRNLADKNTNDIFADIRLIHIQACKKNEALTGRHIDLIQNKFSLPLRHNLSSIAAMDYLILDVLKDECPLLKPEILAGLLQTLINNRLSRIDKAMLYEFLSTLSIYRGNLGEAVGYIRDSLLVKFDSNRKLREIDLLKQLNRNKEREIAITQLRNYLEQHPTAYLAFYKSIDNLK